MSATSLTTAHPAEAADPVPLEVGDHLDQPTFHERYEQMPYGIRAELVEGVVYMPSPLKVDHGDVDGELITWLKLYKAATPGTRALSNTTVVLGAGSEVQPDGLLMIEASAGGQARIDDRGYVTGGPELLAEVALSSAAYDMHSKRRDYEQAGVLEYVVVLLRERRVVWLVREQHRFAEASPGDDGWFRSQVFGGLWLDPQALLDCDTQAVQQALMRGLQSDEHRAFTGG
ncbi:MAG: Uma2 family endonuclease [Planctomycetes bacterium]|nr:Uma2 family endonuclease [Planctomycetota bacterium]